MGWFVYKSTFGGICVSLLMIMRLGFLFAVWLCCRVRLTSLLGLAASIRPIGCLSTRLCVLAGSSGWVKNYGWFGFVAGMFMLPWSRFSSPSVAD